MRLRIVLAVLTWLSASGAFAKSPEDFVGTTAPPPAVPAAKAQAKTAPAPAAAPTAAAKPAATAAKPSPGAPPASTAAKPVPAKVVMDTAKLHATYLDGDFDQAIRTMETALKSKKIPLTHADSVFIFKHLGVMYAATPATREKGRYYMAQLIYIEPTAKILDMYASDMIYLIFRNVQEEFENKNPNVAKAKAVPADTVKPVAEPIAAPAPAAPVASQGSSHKKAYMITGGAVVAVGTIGLLYILLNDPEPTQHKIELAE
ncbi:MAG: hypothetical protein JWP91_3050 [Fibrobacteres bacterium]|nr:hypothetical protein [Fibrobacterota bacterium]